MTIRVARLGSSTGAGRQAAAVCGLLGPVLLVVYFAAPAVTAWPYAGASPHRLLTYAISHAGLFYAGAWFQATGTFLSVVFFLALLQAGGAQSTFWGHLLLVTATSLLAVVLVEAAFLMAVPEAAQAGDESSVATSFALSNGVFARVFPLAPASGSYIALGAVILGSAVLPRGFGLTAIVLGMAFEITGLTAIFSPIGLFGAIGLSVLQVVWIVAAAAAFGLRRPR